MKIQVNNIKLYYEVEGNGRPLIMLHGNGEDCSIFYESLIILKKYYRVYLIDSRGHGKSQNVDFYDYQSMCEDIASFIQQLNLKDVTIYGASDGGIIGLLVTSQYPDLVHNLIISGANTNPKALKANILKMMKDEYRLTRDPLLKMMLEQPHISNRELTKIKANTLIIVGDDDCIKLDHTLNIKNNISNSELLILENEDHSSYIVHNSKIANIILEYLKRIYH